MTDRNRDDRIRSAGDHPADEHGYSNSVEAISIAPYCKSVRGKLKDGLVLWWRSIWRVMVMC